MSNYEIEEKLRSLQLKYLDQVQERMGSLEKFYNHASHNKMSKRDWSELKLHAHKLAGNGSIFGFPDISRNAQAIVRAIDEDHAQTQQIATMIKQLLMVCDAAQQTPRAHAHSYYKKEQETKKTGQLPLILLVDDDENLWHIMFDIFRGLTRIITCSNAEDGIRLMLTHKPDLVLLDDIMPGIHGHQMLEQVHLIAEIANIPIIMVTVNGKPEHVARGINAGAIDYIIKPFTHESIKERVMAHLKLKA